ncbi:MULTISPECIES: hypothetical protein [Acinetobacter]|uniref:hypothetical protein n=1 Tax=Acinetobacter TaxID=469 RepID=UPI000B3D20ED|nr:MULTISPECIES: hypothetical protein [Acinetobacter]MDM1245256.1 hypothetical protein [Acinetobacter indicus]MDM1289309.1 hypothetical protein [Acinetobacter indicus]
MIFNLNKISKDSAVYKAYIRLANNLSNNSPIFFEKYDASIRNYDFVVCANIWHVLLTWFYLIGSKTKIIFWVQGAIAEESYLKHNSKLKFYILKFLEKICLNLSDAYIYVSPYMMEFYSKDKAVLNKPALVFPCISDLQYNKIKKEPNSFCYLGGMSAWQNFPKIIEMMSIISQKIPNSVFKVATHEIDICNEVIEKYASNALKEKLTIVSLSTKSEIENFLSNCEFGFLIRDDIVVNHVSSPIKLAEYLSCGVNVITTSSIRSYSPLLKDAGIILNSKQDLDQVNFNPNTSAAINLYQELFSKESVENNVKVFLKKLKG